jgi:outer membrane beta-barrel protein
MESRTGRIFLTPRAALLPLLLASSLAMSGCAALKWPWFGRDRAPEPEESVEEAEEAEQAELEREAPRVIEPQVERRDIKVPKIDSENFELGVSYGFLSIEDFGTNPVYGVTGTYHVTEDFFFKADVGRSKSGRSSVERLGVVQLLTEDERQFTYYSLSLGYNFLPGEVFIGRNLAMNSSFYVMGGIGNTKFGGDNRLTYNFGAGFRLLPSDWLALHIGVQDRVFDSDLLGTTKVSNNIEMVMSATVFF